MKIVLIGGNPKGHSIPFHPSTLSGKRLRNLLHEIGLPCDIADMTMNSNDIPTQNEIKKLIQTFRDYQIIFLGRFVEKALRPYFPTGVYLPHPASRRGSDLIRLREGLINLSINDGNFLYEEKKTESILQASDFHSPEISPFSCSSSNK